MKLIPTWPIASVCLAVGLVVGAGGMRAWDADTIHDLELEIERIQKRQAEDVAGQFKAGLENLTDATKIIKEQASGSATDITALSTKLDAINRKFNNAKPPTPLAADCRPGPERVQRLTEGAAAVDAAIVGSASRK